MKLMVPKNLQHSQINSVALNVASVTATILPALYPTLSLSQSALGDGRVKSVEVNAVLVES